MAERQKAINNGSAPTGYADHLTQAKEQFGKLEMQRYVLLGQVRELEAAMDGLRRHIGQLEELEKKPAEA